MIHLPKQQKWLKRLRCWTSILLLLVAISSFTVSAQTSHGLLVSWTASVSTGVAGESVYRATVSGGPYTKLNAALLPVATTSFLDPVTDGKKYFYVVTATSLPPIAIESPLSVEATNTAPLAPLPPTGVGVTPQ